MLQVVESSHPYRLTSPRSPHAVAQQNNPLVPEEQGCHSAPLLTQLY